MNNQTKFRQSKRWKQFRLDMIFRTKCTCELCGTQYGTGKKYTQACKQLQVHHLRPLEYDFLRPTLFKVVCSSCHDLIERMAVKKSWGVKWLFWYQLLKDFMPDNSIKFKEYKDLMEK